MRIRNWPVVSSTSNMEILSLIRWKQPAAFTSGWTALGETDGGQNAGLSLGKGAISRPANEDPLSLNPISTR